MHIPGGQRIVSVKQGPLALQFVLQFREQVKIGDNRCNSRKKNAKGRHFRYRPMQGKQDSDQHPGEAQGGCRPQAFYERPEGHHAERRETSESEAVVVQDQCAARSDLPVQPGDRFFRPGGMLNHAKAEHEIELMRRERQLGDVRLKDVKPVVPRKVQPMGLDSVAGIHREDMRAWRSEQNLREPAGAASNLEDVVRSRAVKFFPNSFAETAPRSLVRQPYARVGIQLRLAVRPPLQPEGRGIVRSLRDQSRYGIHDFPVVPVDAFQAVLRRHQRFSVERTNQTNRRVVNIHLIASPAAGLRRCRRFSCPAGRSRCAGRTGCAARASRRRPSSRGSASVAETP